MIVLEPGTFTTPAPGEIQTDKAHYVIADINPVGLTDQCQRSGRVYLCGHYGSQAWEVFLRSKKITCEQQTATGKSLTVRCTVDSASDPKVDIGWWLINAGFATAKPQAPAHYHSAEDDARKRRSGIHSAD